MTKASSQAANLGKNKAMEVAGAMVGRAVEQTDEVVFTTQPDGKITYVNPAFEALYGFTKEETLGKNPRIIKSGKMSREYYEKFWEEILTGRTHRAEHINKTKDGRIVTVQATVTPIMDDTYKLVAFVSIQRDISALKQAQKMLRENELRFHQLVENCKDIVFRYRFAPTPGMEYISPSVIDVLGYSPEDHYADPYMALEMVHPDDRQKLKKILHGKGFEERLFLRYIHKDGKVVWIEGVAIPIYDESGNLVAMEGIARDDTQRRRSEELLKESEEQFRRAFEESPIGASLVGSDHKFVKVNKALTEMLGYTEQELLRRSVVDVTHPDDVSRSLSLSEKMFEGKIPGFRFEKRYLKKNGETVWIDLTATSVHSSDGAFLFGLGMVQNITERKRAEKTLLDYQKRLKSLVFELSRSEEAERRRIAANLHDEVGQNLALSKIKLGSLKELISSSEGSQITEEIGELIADVIKDMRSLSYELSPAVLYEFGFEQAVEWLVEETEDKSGLMCRLENDQKPKPLDHDTSVVLFQSVRELLMNTVRHGRASHVKITLWNKDSQIGIRVEDNGVGFDTSKVKLLPSVGGGFGLFSIRERLEALGGTFQIQSQRKRGTRVIMMVPLKSG